MSQITHGEVLAKVTFGYDFKLVMPLDDAMTLMKSFKNAVVVNEDYGKAPTFSSFKLEDSKMKIELVHQLEINKAMSKAHLVT